MIDEAKILQEIQTKLYQRDVDYSLNIFLCGAETNKKASIRDLLNVEFKKDAKFNAVYPEYIFASLYGKGGHNLLELEDELANYVDIIILPLEGIGTYCELGAFAVNRNLLPKIILLNDRQYEKSKSFINLGPVDLIKKHNPKNIIYFNSGKESSIIESVLNRVKSIRLEKLTPSYDLENIFNLSRFILYLIAIFQPINKKGLESILKRTGKLKIKAKHIDTAIQILTQKNRIEFDIDIDVHSDIVYSLSDDGHHYVYEELIEKLNVKNEFTKIRCQIINDKYNKQKKFMSKDKKLLLV